MPIFNGWVENFDKITLSCTVKKIQANFCFSNFGKNLKIQNGRHFWEEENFLKIAKSTFLDTLWVKNFTEIILFCTVKANLCFSILGQNSKIQNGRHMWGGEKFLKIAKRCIRKFEMAAIFLGGEIFLKIAKSTFLRYPVG